jgi:hypothetical protein
MAYLHCHNCNWSQDDFWHNGYNPAKNVKDYYDEFMKDPNKKIYFDMDWVQEAKIKWGKDDKGYYVMAKDMFVWEMEREARTVKNMNVYTWEDWTKVNEDWKCPNCEKHNPDID